MTLNAAAMVIDTTVASESMPSMKFIAFITPTIQSTERDDAEEAEVEDLAGDGDLVELKAEGDQDQRRRELHGELLRRVRADEVVVDAEADDERAAGEDGEEVGEVLRDQVRRARVRGQEQQRKAEAEDDGEPPRRGVATPCSLRSSGTSTRPMCCARVLHDGRRHVRRQRAADEQENQRHVVSVIARRKDSRRERRARLQPDSPRASRATERPTEAAHLRSL